MAFRIKFWRRRQEPVAAAEAVAETPPPPPPPPPSFWLSAWWAVWGAVVSVFEAIDRALVSFAVLFGVQITAPRTRHAVLLGIFAVIYLLGSLPVPVLPLVALGFGYVGVLAIGRAWVLNEKERTAIAKKLKDDDPDQMPDLRWTAFASALQLLILLPLIFMQAQEHFHLYRIKDDATPNFLNWLWFSLDKTYLKALPDWSTLYDIHYRGVEFASPWGRHLVLLSRLTFDYILIQGAIRIFAIRSTISEAVAAIRVDPDMAVRLGRRGIAPLVEKLSDPDKAVRGAAANALVRLGDKASIQRITETAE